MAIDLKKYLTEKYQRTISESRSPGPVITISRQYGCAAKELAFILTDKLNAEGKSKQKWTWINKEIFEGTAKALNLKESRILHVFEGEKKGLIESVILSSSEKYYASDTKIKKKIIEIARSFAEQGHVIIIGLGGVAITRDIEKSLHIRLHAPFEWRVQKAAAKLNKTFEEVANYATAIDQKREKLRQAFLPKSSAQEFFDVCFNTMTLNYNEIADSVMSLLKIKRLI